MVTCEQGHPSDSDDYCDVCGSPIRADTSLGAGPAPSQPGVQQPEPCANCGAPRGGRFCEACGHDASAPAEPAARSQARPVLPEAGQLVAVVRPDHDWYQEVRRRNGPDVDVVEFPRYCPDRHFTLAGSRLTIGRRSRSRGTDPDIDLSGPPLDPGISAQQAVLLARPDGGWDIVDLGSTNGTTINSAPDPIPPGVPVHLPPGVTVQLGAWTEMTFEPPR